ncbi:jg6717 [Pararge aegeria aegeria]|uniref:Jg6717 protein n=1 Tax=Pararge aegeria aegeria TaxID=348720 RepID=A0A8S4SIA1_9NEOP|nr:jg6717 [Pararge aegeria aegeria]
MADNGDRSSLLPLPKRSIATTIELPILLNMIAVSLTGSALSNIILYRTCVHSLGHTEYECKPFLSPIKTNATAGLEEDVQRYSTYISTVKMVLEYLCPAVLSMFLGVWSDTYGRKPLIVWPLFGMAISGILIVIFAMIETLSPWWYVATAVPFSITGGYIVMFTGSAISLFKGLTGPLLRSFLTKNFPMEDIAKIFAFLCAVESIGPMLAPVIFNSLYSVTLATFPGAIYVLSSVMNAACLIMLGFVLMYSRKGSSAIYQTIDNDIDS